MEKKRQSKRSWNKGTFTPSMTDSHCRIPAEYASQHPGKLLGETMNALMVERRAFKLPAGTINGILEERETITPTVANQLSRVLGISASFWTTLSANHEAFLKEKGKHAAA